MAQASPRLYQAQAANTRRTHNAKRSEQPNRSRQQQQRERLELRALALGARYDLAQLAADRWMREVQP